MNKSVILLGKGPSILRTTSEYVNSFDDVAIINKPVWDGYERHLPKRANIQYRNNSTISFSKNEILNLGLKRIVSVAIPGQTLVLSSDYDMVEVEYPPFMKGPNVNGDDSILLEVGDNKKTFLPSSGVLAFYHLLQSRIYSKISLVGLDLLLVGERVYYFEPHEMQDNLKYLLNDITYSRNDFVRLETSLHDEGCSIQLIYDKMSQAQDIDFEVTTNNKTLISMISDLDNVKIL